MEEEQVTPHEAGRFTAENAKQMGAKGAAARERNLAEQATETRQELAAHAEEATRRLVDIIQIREGHRRPEGCGGAVGSDGSWTTLITGCERGHDLHRAADP